MDDLIKPLNMTWLVEVPRLTPLPAPEIVNFDVPVYFPAFHMPYWKLPLNPHAMKKIEQIYTPIFGTYADRKQTMTFNSQAGPHNVIRLEIITQDK
eukprot:Pgem_evm3s2241